MKITSGLALATSAFAMLLGTVGAQAQMSDAEMAELVAAAQAEGSVVIYSGASSVQLERYAADFNKDYGIPVEIVRLTGAQTTQRFATEQAAGLQGADIVGTSESAYFDGNSEWFMDLSKENLPHYEAWPEDSKSPYRVIMSRGVLGLIYNKDLVSPEDAPRVWQDVIDPKWNGQIILADTQSSVNWGGWLKAMHDTFGDPYIQTLAGMDFQVVASGQTGAQQIAAGAKPLNFPSAISFASGLIADGAPVEYVYMAEPTVTNRFNFGAAANAPHPNAAKLFMDWLISDAGITSTCATNYTVSPGDPDGALGCMARPEGNIVEIAEGLDEAEMTTLFDMLGVK